MNFVFENYTTIKLGGKKRTITKKASNQLGGNVPKYGEEVLCLL